MAAQPHLDGIITEEVTSAPDGDDPDAQEDHRPALDRPDPVHGGAGPRRHDLRARPAGTGKTYLAVAQAVSQLISGSVDRLILSRPAVEAGERLGFLPGDMKEKVDPYLRPLYDALYDMLPTEQVERRIASGEIEIAPIAFMRGRTLNDAFIILDEAQNTTPLQMKMFLTRFGMRSRMVICGDPQPGRPARPEQVGPGRRGRQARAASRASRWSASPPPTSSATRSSGASSRPMKVRR